MKSEVQAVDTASGEALIAPKNLVEDCNKHVRAGYISYLVSATLHGRGALAFWGSGVAWTGDNWFFHALTRIIAVVDLFWHVGLWIWVSIFECWVYDHFRRVKQNNHGAEYHMANGANDESRVILEELFVGQFIGYLVAAIALVICIIFGLFGQPSGKAWPSTICFLFGGLKASLLFTLLIIVVASDKWDGFNSVMHEGLNGHQQTVTVRQMLLWLVGLKCLLLQQLSANEKFWGSASEDDAYANICSLLSYYKSGTERHLVNGERNNKILAGGGWQQWSSAA